MALNDLQLLAKYQMVDPLLDALLFARMVDMLARARRAHLKADIVCRFGELVSLTYKIHGFDSAGVALAKQADCASEALADCIRELNLRYARSRSDR